MVLTKKMLLDLFKMLPADFISNADDATAHYAKTLTIRGVSFTKHFFPKDDNHETHFIDYCVHYSRGDCIFIEHDGNGGWVIV